MFSAQQGGGIGRAAIYAIRQRTRRVQCLTPIKLISWGHDAAIVNEFKAAGPHCRFFKCDRKSAYETLPVDPAQTGFAAVVLKSPIGGKYYAFTSKTLLFGSIASVIHYNVFARIITELVNRIFGIPLISFWGDFGGLMIPELLGDDLSTFNEVCKRLNIELEPEKRNHGSPSPFWAY